MKNQLTIQQYAAKARADFLALLDKVVDNCPELLNEPLARENAAGYISDMCGDLFGLLVEEAECETSSYDFNALARDESTYHPVGGRA